MNGHSGHYGKWNKSDTERLIPCDLTFMWSPKAKTKQTHGKREAKLTEKRIARGWWVGKMDESVQKVQTLSYKITKSWGFYVEHGDYS